MYIKVTWNNYSHYFYFFFAQRYNKKIKEKYTYVPYHSKQYLIHTWLGHRICGRYFFTEDLVSWTQQEFSKIHAKAAPAGTSLAARWSGK